jgi:hypothetical protein
LIMLEIPDDSVYPGIFGVEEELWVTHKPRGERVEHLFGSADIEAALGIYQQSGGMLKPGQGPPIVYEAQNEIPAMRQFNSVGGREYADGHNPERAIPETSSVREAIARSRGVEQFGVALSQCLLIDNPDVDEVIHHRRVGWLGSDFIGTQDSIYAPPPKGDGARTHNERIERMLSAMAVTRPYLTGAGSYTADGRLVFSQKIQALDRYIFNQEQMAVARTGTGRIEIRQNDININDAVAMMRLGGAAIGAALARTNLLTGFERFIRRAMSSVNTPGRYNTPAFDADGQGILRKNNEILWAIEQHMRIADVFASADMRRAAGEQPDELLQIAERIHSTSEMMRQILRGRMPVAAATSVSDWAAKHDHHLRNGATDYDTTIIARNGSTGPVIDRQGFGFDLRDAGVFAGDITQAEVDTLYCQPPQDTNARVRASIIGSYATGRMFWRQGYVDGVDENGNPTEIRITFGGPRDTVLARTEQKKLQRATPLHSAGLPADNSEESSAPGAADAVTDAIYRVIDATKQEPQG